MKHTRTHARTHARTHTRTHTHNTHTHTHTYYVTPVGQPPQPSVEVANPPGQGTPSNLFTSFEFRPGERTNDKTAAYLQP